MMCMPLGMMMILSAIPAVVFLMIDETINEYRK